WTEIRRRLKRDQGLDHDPSNLADPLLPYEALRALVLKGEASAAETAVVEDGEGDLRDIVQAIRSRASARRP
ncbi:MAG: hypothetical protein M3R54_02245, partial [Chloroflexota bacterium]|nr:hypothetical protein [Chloroflexota bacterium]